VTLTRRSLVTLMGGVAFISACGHTREVSDMDELRPGTSLFGLIGQMKAQPGKRAELLAILTEGTRKMPGCLHYIIAEDEADADSLWITEVWTSAGQHEASLKLPEVKSAIAKGRPLIAGFGTYAKTKPVGGVGI
jgi:quinol monooxygenase YgiN